MKSLVDALLLGAQRASVSLAEELRGIATLGAMLETTTAAGREAHPHLIVSDDAWAGFLARHLRAGDVARQLAELRAGDVHLVLACEAGNAAAHRELDARLHGVAKQALMGINLGSVTQDELLQGVREKLLFGDSGAGKIATYSGRGPLDGWLRVTLARAALSLVRLRDPNALHVRDDAVLADLAGTDDPQLAVLRARCAPALKRAIEDAAMAMPAADRALLRLHFVDGLSIDDLAGIYKAHRSTTARRLARARSAIFEGARARAIAELGLGEDEFASFVGVMMSQIDLTIGRILRSSS